MVGRSPVGEPRPRGWNRVEARRRESHEAYSFDCYSHLRATQRWAHPRARRLRREEGNDAGHHEAGHDHDDAGYHHEAGHDYYDASYHHEAGHNYYDAGYDARDDARDDAGGQACDDAGYDADDAGHDACDDACDDAGGQACDDAGHDAADPGSCDPGSRSPGSCDSGSRSPVGRVRLFDGEWIGLARA